MGDFNDLMSSNEKRGGRDHPRDCFVGFTETVRACGLIDFGFVGDKFTWEKSRGKSNWVQEWLDRGLANKTWCELFPLAEVRILEVTTLDHLPLHL